MRRSFEGKRHQPAKSEEKRKRCDRKHRGFGFFCAFLLCAGLISGGAAVSGESGAQEAVNAEAPADDAVQPEVPAQPVEEAQQNTPAPEDTEGGGEAGQQQEETPDQQQEELYPEDDGNGEESVPSVSRPDAGSAESSAAPVGTTAEPLTVSVTTAMKYAFAGENVLTFETQITGGTEPFETSCEIDRDGTPVWSSQEYQPEVTYMPEEAGGYELVLSVTDAAGQAASGRCAIPVAVRHEESPSDWEPALKEVRMTGRYAEDLLAIARTQLGYTESADNFIVTEEGARQGYTRYGQWQGDAYEPWDAAFAAFCLYYAGVRDVPADTKAEKWADELKRRGMYRDLTAENRPEEGDFLFTRDGEVTRIGLVEKTDDTGVTAIEGDVGGAVARVTYGWDDARLAGFGDPRTTLTDEAAGVTVTGIFPEGATLTVQLLAEDADGFTEAQDRIHAALSPLYDRYAVNLADVTETAVYVPSLTVNGEAVSPCKKVRVGVSACGGRFAGHGDVRVLTFSDEQTELLSAEEKDGGDGADAIVSASFRTDRLSEFALTAVAPDRLTMRRTAADGDAKVTVTYGAGAGVPESAELRVRQIRGDGDDADRAEYQKRQAEAAALLETEAGGENAASQPDTAASGSPGNAENADVSRQTDQNAENAAADQQADQNAENVAADQTEDSKEYAAYMEEVEAALASGRKVQMAKLFDITILDKEGNEVEPLTPVRANIEFAPKEVQEGTDLELYQFQTEGEKPQVMENVEVLTDDDNIVNGIEFETDGFSVYGIVGTEVLTGGVMTADGDSYSVTVKYDKYAEIPDDAVLVATEVQNSSRLYQSYMSEAEDALTSDSDAEISFARFFDVSIMADGEKIQPATPAEVIIDYNESQEITEGTEVSTLQFGDSVPATVDAAVSGTDTQVDGVSFQAEEVSVYGIVGTESITVPFTTGDGRTYEVTVDFDKDAGIPEGAQLKVSEVTEDNSRYDDYVEQAADAIDSRAEALNYIKLLNIEIVDENGDKVDLEAPVDVTIKLLDKEQNEEEQTQVVHFEGANEMPVVLDSSAEADTVSFSADGFSVYAIVYTVDFEYSVNGKMYQFSLPGGGFVSFTNLVEVLGIIGDTNSEEYGDENGSAIAENAEENGINEGAEEDGINSDTNTALTLGDVEVSEATKKFVADVASVEFSTPSLVDVSKVESETTVGQIKENRGLECEYSAELTEEQIAEINAQTVEAGDWALISVQPFTSEETLTVTMKDGEVFAIRVTDAQIKKMVIDAKGDTWEITVTYGEDAQIPDGAELRVKEITQEEEAYNDLQDDIMENLADKGEDIPAHPVLFDIAIVCGDQEIEPAEGSEVNVQIRLINNAIKGMFTDEDSPLLVNDDPVTQKMSDIEQNVEVIHQVETGNLDVVNTQDTITEEAVVSEFTTGSFSDWLLFLDETVKNITIGRGDTITLRPYSKWVWKRVAEEEQYKAYEWKVPANNNVISFSKADKTDDQLNETYTYYHGQANNTGSFDLQLTDNGTVVHTIHVTVVEDVPDLPPTIQGTDEIAVNLFDYDINTSDRTKSGTLDQQANVASSSAFRNTSVNRYSDLQFLGYGGSNTDSEWFSINNYTKDVPNQGILDPRLDNGYPKLGLSTEGKTRSKPSLAYLFDTSSRNNDVYAYPNLTGLFQKDTEGYYYYNSNNNYAYYNVNGNSNQITLYKHTYSQWTSGSAGPNAKPIGFFPFHQYDSYLKEGNTGMNFNTNLNHHFGMSMAVDFEIPSDGLDDYGNPITFEFSGDDDMWVFIDDNLVLDVGGIHQPVTGSINFSSDHVSVYGKPDTTITQRFTDANSPTAWEIGDGKPHTMKIFYLERGGCDSNLSVRFNIPRRFGKGKLALVKHEEGKTTPLQGATFKIWDNAECKGEPIAEVTSDGNGNVNFGEFILNSATTTFYMKETDGPDGYIREPRVYQIRPRMNQGAVVKNGDYIVLDVFGPDGNALTKVQNDAVEFPNAKIGTIDIPVKKNWTASSESSAIVELTIKRYKLIDKTKGFMIIKELTGEPEDYQFTAQYTITYPDGHSETVQFDDFDGGVYSLPDAEPGNYVIEETVTSQAPDGYAMTHSTQRVEVTLDEDGMAQANFNTTFQKQKGDLYIKANVDIRNGSTSDIDYSAVRYAVLDESGKKVTSITHAEAVNGKTLNLPVGNYTVKAVSVPKTPTTYSLTQQKINDRNGAISSTLTVRANQQTDAVYSAVYEKKNNAQNCTWKIRDKYSDQAHNWQELIYKSGNVDYPVGTKLRMSFEVPQGKSDLDGVTYNGQTLNGNKTNNPNGKLEYSVEFTVANNATLDYSINVYNTKQIDISGPYFEVVGTANNNAVSPNQAPRNIKNVLRAPSNNTQVDVSNTAAHPDAPEGKKYVKDTVWSQKVTLNSGNNWQDSTTLKNLPKCDEEGNPYYYYVASVHETGVSEGTSCSIDLDNGKQLLIGNDLNSGSNLSVTNKQTGSLKITKDVTVNASPVTDHTKASPADGIYTFEITKKGDASFAKRTVELTVTNGGASTEEIDELEPGIYTVTELKPENGSEISSINGTPTQLYSAEIEVRAGMTGTTAASLTFVNNIVDTRLKVIKVKKGTTEPVFGAVFALTKVDNEGRQITTQGDSYYKEETVDAITGELEFTGLTKGRYKLEETHVPDGYVKKETAYFISIGNDGAGALDLTVPHTMINPKSGSDFTVENEPGVALPSTGGPGTNLLYLLGSLMLALGSAGFVMRKRRRVG